MARCKAEPCFPTRSLQVCRSSSLVFSGLMFSACSPLESSSSSEIKIQIRNLHPTCLQDETFSKTYGLMSLSEQAGR